MSGEPHPDDPTTFYARPAKACLPDPQPRETEPKDQKPALTPEEQMEQFAKELKENDWGHQPC